MDEITAPRIEPLSQGNDLDKYPQRKDMPRRETPRKPEPSGKPSPSPSIEADDLVEDVHQIDELA
jgi:hypothetical protein